MDYIFAVINLNTFRAALRHVDSNLVSIDEDGVATIRSPTTMVKYNGNQSVAICRINATEAAEMQTFDSVKLCGSASKIEKHEDVNWVDEALYYSIHEVTPIEFTDEDGVVSAHTPPKLHCVFA